MVVQVAHDHHCPWREAFEQLEQRTGALLAEQQTLIAEQQGIIGVLQAQMRELLQRQQTELAEQAAQRDATIARLEKDVAALERRLLGPKREHVRVPAPENEKRKPELDEEARARRREEIAKKRREQALARSAAMDLEEVDYTVLDADRCCPSCGNTDLPEMAVRQSVTFGYEPGRFVRRRHRQQALACKCGKGIVVAKGPERMVLGMRYETSFAAYVVVAKCADSIPVHRLEKRFGRLGIPLSRSTMNDLLHAAAEKARPLVDRLRTRVAAMSIVLADETSFKIADRDKRGFVWVFHGHDDETDAQLALYVCATSRSGDTAAKLLGGTEGALIVDGYTGYNDVTDPEGRERGGCMSHLRRKFFEARASAPVDADEAIALIRELFMIERQAWETGIVRTEAHRHLRFEKSVPALDELHAWMVRKKDEHLPKSPMAQAIGYGLRQWDRLSLFVRDPRIPIHNNSSERRLRVVALGRSNYLFFGHPRAGRNICGLYSLVGSCIANAVEPTEYLTDVLLRVRDDMTGDELDELLPDRWTPRRRE